VIPVSQARPQPVELDEVLNTFDPPTQVAIRQNLTEFGNALAGRGPTLNDALGTLPGVLELLEPVTRNLASSSTRLERMLAAMAATAAEVAPVAETQAELFVSLDTTFTALARVARPFIQETITETPPTLDVATRTLPRIRPFLAHSRALFADLRPGVGELVTVSPALADALVAGIPALRESPTQNRELAPTAEALLRFNDDADVRAGLSRLTQTTDILGPTLRFIAPAQTICNYGTLLARNAASLLSQGSGGGRWQRFTVFDPPDGPNNEGSPSTAPANGGGDVRNFLHYNPYPNTAAPQQEPRECEAGNEGYRVGRQVIGNVPGNQGTVTEAQSKKQLRKGGNR
jgi:hypothetical protein